MKEEKDYIRDITEIRSMMERSSKFLSLSGLAGTLAGIYALLGAYIAYRLFDFNPNHVSYQPPSGITNMVVLGLAVLSIAVLTAVILSGKKAGKRQEKAWNPVSRRLMAGMLVPLVCGGLLLLIFLNSNLTGLVLPCTMIFYGIALYNAGNFSYGEIRSMGLILCALGLLSAFIVEYSLLLWAAGFGVVHIFFGIYMHFRYER